MDDAVEHAKENGYVTTVFGRRRPVPELSSSNFMQRSFGERVAMNAPIQGTAADIMKIAMNGVNRRLKENNMKSKLVLQVHDELLIEAYEEELEDVRRFFPMRWCMRQNFMCHWKWTCIQERTGTRQNNENHWNYRRSGVWKKSGALLYERAIWRCYLSGRSSGMEIAGAGMRLL